MRACDFLMTCTDIPKLPRTCMYIDISYYQIDISEQTDVPLQCCMQIYDDHFTIGLVLGLHRFCDFSNVVDDKGVNRRSY
jgi:hypothetical protein